MDISYHTDNPSKILTDSNSIAHTNSVRRGSATRYNIKLHQILYLLYPCEGNIITVDLDRVKLCLGSVKTKIIMLPLTSRHLFIRTDFISSLYQNVF